MQQAQCGNSSVGRALASQAGGRGFEPRLPLFSPTSSLFSHTHTHLLCEHHTHMLPFYAHAARCCSPSDDRPQVIKKGPATNVDDPKKQSDSAGIQTRNLLIRSQMLYSVELRSRFLILQCENGHDCGCKGNEIFSLRKPLM